MAVFIMCSLHYYLSRVVLSRSFRRAANHLAPDTIGLKVIFYGGVMVYEYVLASITQTPARLHKQPSR